MTNNAGLLRYVRHGNAVDSAGTPADFSAGRHGDATPSARWSGERRGGTLWTAALPEAWRS